MGMGSHQQREGGYFHVSLTTGSLPSFLKPGLVPEQNLRSYIQPHPPDSSPPTYNSLVSHHTLPESLKDCGNNCTETINYYSRPWYSYSNCKFKFGCWPLTTDTDSLALNNLWTPMWHICTRPEFVSFCGENHHSYFLHVDNSLDFEIAHSNLSLHVGQMIIKYWHALQLSIISYHCYAERHFWALNMGQKGIERPSSNIMWKEKVLKSLML